MLTFLFVGLHGFLILGSGWLPNKSYIYSNHIHWNCDENKLFLEQQWWVGVFNPPIHHMKQALNTNYHTNDTISKGCLYTRPNDHRSWWNGIWTSNNCMWGGKRLTYISEPNHPNVASLCQVYTGTNLLILYPFAIKTKTHRRHKNTLNLTKVVTSRELMGINHWKTDIAFMGFKKIY